MPDFDVFCLACPRLASHLNRIRDRYPSYYARPVPAFGDPEARLLIVGLAPGMHGANRSGRPFTGDYAGILLYQTLHKFGFASKPESVAVNDGLQLMNCRITNAVKCLPPENKPVAKEINTCNAYLQTELQALAPGSVILALGGIAHKSVAKALGLKQSDYIFGHNHYHKIQDDLHFIDSYHCSRYNTQTRRLTQVMFEEVFQKVQTLLAEST
jgi:uracil-DNA glycosylase family 4